MSHHTPGPISGAGLIHPAAPGLLESRARMDVDVSPSETTPLAVSMHAKARKETDRATRSRSLRTTGLRDCRRVCG